MVRSMAIVALVSLAVALAAGCVSPGPRTVADVWAEAPPLDWNPEATLQWWEDLARMEKRDSYLPANEEVRSFLIAELQRIGMEVEVRSYPASVRGVVVEPAPADLVAIVGTKAGRSVDRLGLVSHFDTQTLTIQGAYDDASGVAAEFAICEALSKVELEHTLACIFFDGEEQGLEASRMYVDDVVVEGDEGYVYDWIFGYGMTGINWPGHDWKMYIMDGGADFVPLLKPLAETVMHELLEYPHDGVEVLDTHDRNSDERRYRDAGVPIYRFAGGRHAADYPEYHRPGDTVEYVYDFVGGPENFQAGLSVIVEASYALAWVADKTNITELANPDHTW